MNTLQASVIDRGIEALHAGNVDLAEEICREALSQAPRWANAWHLWGAVAFQKREFETAIDRMLQAIEIAPTDPQFHSNLGFVLVACGNFVAAEVSYRTSLNLAPRNADTWFKLGNVQLAKKDHLAARESYRRAIELNPQLSLAYSNLGASLVATNELQEAVNALEEGLQFAPEISEVYSNLGHAYERLEQYDRAETCFRRALVLTPKSSENLLALAHNLVRKKRADEALLLCQTASVLSPEDAIAWRALGFVFSSLRRNEEAETAFREALHRESDHVDTLVNHCIVLHDLGRLDESIQVGQRATRTDPSSSSAFDNLGAAFSRKAEFDQALACFDRSLALDANNSMAHFHLGLTLLAMGRFDEGWPEYEWRFDHPHSVCRECKSPRWTGEPLAGRSILLQAEQGFGDTLQFIRYAQLLRAQGARVTLECSPALKEFLRHCQIVDELVSSADPLPTCDFHCPLMSLGHVLNITPNEPAVSLPYLFPEPERIAIWKPVLQQLSGLKIGIAWQGDPKHTWDRFRSLRLTEFAPLANVPGTTLVSIQYGIGEEQLTTSSLPIRTFRPRLDHDEHSFRDTAAVVSGLDLVIVADTAVAHLAGGLGVPTWLLLNAAPDWRWGLSGSTTPWYPKMRLFRQSRLGDWTGVFDNLVHELLKASRVLTPDARHASFAFTGPEIISTHSRSWCERLESR